MHCLFNLHTLILYIRLLTYLLVNNPKGYLIVANSILYLNIFVSAAKKEVKIRQPHKIQFKETIKKREFIKNLNKTCLLPIQGVELICRTHSLHCQDFITLNIAKLDQSNTLFLTKLMQKNQKERKKNQENTRNYWKSKLL